MDKEELWRAVLGELEVTLSQASFTTWFKDTFILSLSHDEAVVAVPNGFAKEWLEKKYSLEIAAALRKQLPGLKQLLFKVASPEALVAPRLSLPASNEPSLPPSRPNLEEKTQETFPDTLNPRYIFEAFVVGNSNRLAHAAAVAVAQSPGSLHNPLFLYGGVGLGKTHLIHAIGHEIRLRHRGIRVLCVDCEQFTSEFIQALRAGQMEKFKKRYRGVDVFLVDDIQFLAAKEGTQEEFFHTFNALHQKGRQIVLTSDRVPKAIPQLEVRLSSRFGWGLVADIQPPNFEMRVAILRNKAQERGLLLPEEVANFLAEGIHSNIRDLEGILNRLGSWCQLNGVSPTVEVAQEMMGGFLGRKDWKNVSPAQVLATVSNFYNLSPADLISSRRTADLVLPRQLTMFILRKELGLSFPRIGLEMGGKDHTTIMHGVERFEKGCQTNEELREELSAIKERLYRNLS